MAYIDQFSGKLKMNSKVFSFFSQAYVRIDGRMLKKLLGS